MKHPDGWSVADDRELKRCDRELKCRRWAEALWSGVEALPASESSRWSFTGVWIVALKNRRRLKRCNRKLKRRRRLKRCNQKLKRLRRLKRCNWKLNRRDEGLMGLMGWWELERVWGDGSDVKKKELKCYIYIDDFISSLLYAFSDEIRFVANNKTYGHRFPFSDDLFSSLNVTFSDETRFALIAWPVAPFSDESVRHKKLKLLVTKKFVTVDQFGYPPPLSFGALNLAHSIVTKFRFRH